MSRQTYMQGFEAGIISDVARKYWFNEWQRQQASVSGAGVWRKASEKLMNADGEPVNAKYDGTPCIVKRFKHNAAVWHVDDQFWIYEFDFNRLEWLDESNEAPVPVAVSDEDKKPKRIFFIDEVSKDLNLLLKEEMSMSRFVEILNEKATGLSALELYKLQYPEQYKKSM